MREDLELAMIEELVREGYSLDYKRASISTARGMLRHYYVVTVDVHKLNEAKTFPYNEIGLKEASALFLQFKKDLKKT